MGSRDEIVRFIYAVTGDDQLAATAATMLKAGEAADSTSTEFDKFSKSLRDAASQASLIQKALSQKAGLAELKAQLADAQAGLEKLNTEFDKTDTSNKKVTKAFNDAEKAVASLTTQVNQQQAALAKTEGGLAKAGVDTTNLAAAFQKVNADGNAAANALAQLGTAGAKAAAGTQDAAAGTKKLADEGRSAGDVFESLKAHLGEIAVAAGVAAVALKAIDFGKTGFTEATAVETSLSRVQALAKGAATDFEALGGAIDDAARAANVSSSTAAAAASALAEQGETANDIFKTLTPTLLLARDANIEVAQSAAIVDDVLDLLGKSAGDAADVVDKLVVASKGSKEGLAGMADAIRQLAPDAQALGLDFDHLLGLLGDFTQNGIDAGKAVRGLRTVFQDLQNPTSAFALALHDLGDSSSDFGTAIDTLRGAGDRGQKALLSLDGAARSLVLFLLQQGPGAVDGFVASLQRAQGAAEATRKALDDNLGGAFTALEHSLDSLGAGLADSTLKPLRNELQSLADRLNDFAKSQAFDAIKKSLTDLFTAGTAAFENFIATVDWPAFIKSIQIGISDAAKTIDSFKDDIAGVATAINTIGATIGVFARGIAVAFDALKTGVSESVAVVALLAAKMSEVQDSLTNGGFESAATRIFRSINVEAEKAANEGGDALEKNLGNLFDNLKAVGDAGATAAPKIAAIGDSAKAAGAATASAAADAASASQDFNAVTGTLDDMATALGILTPSLNLAADAQRAAKTAATEHAEQIVILGQEVATAKAKLDELVTSGNASADAMNKAALDYRKAQDALDQLTGKTSAVVDSQRTLQQAFKDLGIVSQKALNDTADTARRNLDAIRAAFLSGGATIEDEKRAFEAWAQTVRASVADSSQAVQDQKLAQIAAEAAALGFTDAATKAGAAGAQAGTDTAEGFDKATQSIQDASDASSNLATNAAAAATGVSALGSGAASASSSVASLATGVQGIALLSADQLRLLKEIGQEFLSGAISGEEYARRVLVAMGGIDEELQRQQEELRQFNSEVNDLQSQLASANGDNVEVENLRHAKKLADIKAETDLSMAQRQQLERLEEQIHEANLKRIKQENDARGGTGTNAQGGGAGTSPTPNTPTPAPTPQAAAPSVSSVFNIVLLSGDKDAVDQLGDLVARRVDQRIKEIARRSV